MIKDFARLQRMVKIFGHMGVTLVINQMMKIIVLMELLCLIENLILHYLK